VLYWLRENKEVCGGKMKNPDVKRSLMPALYYDLNGIEEHLNKMDAEGWKLVEAGLFLWKYKKKVTKERYYYLVEYPQQSRKCSKDGYSYVGLTRRGNFPIFRGKVKLEFSDLERFEEAKNYIVKNVVPRSCLILALILLMSCVIAFSSNCADNRGDWVNGLCICAFLGIIELLCDSIWFARNMKSVSSDNGWVCSKVYGNIMNICIYISLLALLSICFCMK
jgi:hypothetical protein